MLTFERPDRVGLKVEEKGEKKKKDRIDLFTGDKRF